MSDNNNLDLIVDVIVSRDTPALSQQDFNAALFVTDEQVFSERYRQYTSASDLLSDGFDSASPTYKAVRSFFSQGGKVNEVAVGRRDGTVVAVAMTEAQVLNSTNYTITVAGTPYAHTSAIDAEDDKPQAIQDILTALQILVDADVNVSGVISGTLAGTTLTITIDVVGTTVAVPQAEFTPSWTTQESWADCIAAINKVYSLWYMIATYDHSVAGILEIAAEIEAATNLYIASNQNVENLEAVPSGDNPDPANVRGLLEQLNYDRTAFVYSTTADETFIEMAWLGERIWTLPGASIWDQSAIGGVVADPLSRTEINILSDGGGNYFTTYGGIDYVRDGQVASGEWLDTMRGGDNMASDVQIELVRMLGTAVRGGGKIALTEKGMGQLKAGVALICEQYVNRGFLKDTVEEVDPIGNNTIRRGYSIYSALVSSLSSNQRASRTAPDIQVIADLAGAVQKARVLINLYV